MKQLIVPLIALLLSLVYCAPSQSAGLYLGMSGAVKSKVNELDEKIRSNATATSTVTEQETVAKFAPPAGKILLFIGQDKITMDDYVDTLAVVPAGLMFYTSVQNAEGISTPTSPYGGIQDFSYTTGRYPETAVQIGLWMVNALDGVLAGTYDANLDKLGNWIRDSSRPVYLRIGYEFDYPANNYDPDKYVRAFRYIVDRYRSQGIDNIAYVWHSYASTLTRPLTDWYPGDDYVDWFGLSYFSTGNMSYMSQVVTLAGEHNKPVMIAEATPYGIGTGSGQNSWDNWYTGFFDFVADKSIAAVCYIDCNWESIPQFAGQGWGDARVQADTVVKANWLNEIRQSKYLQSSSALFSDLGYK